MSTRVPWRCLRCEALLEVDLHATPRCDCDVTKDDPPWYAPVEIASEHSEFPWPRPTGDGEDRVLYLVHRFGGESRIQVYPDKPWVPASIRGRPGLIAWRQATMPTEEVPAQVPESLSPRIVREIARLYGEARLEISRKLLTPSTRREW